MKHKAKASVGLWCDTHGRVEIVSGETHELCAVAQALAERHDWIEPAHSVDDEETAAPARTKAAARKAPETG